MAVLPTTAGHPAVLAQPRTQTFVTRLGAAIHQMVEGHLVSRLVSHLSRRSSVTIPVVVTHPSTVYPHQRSLRLQYPSKEAGSPSHCRRRRRRRHQRLQSSSTTKSPLGLPRPYGLGQHQRQPPPMSTAASASTSSSETSRSPGSRAEALAPPASTIPTQRIRRPSGKSYTRWAAGGRPRASPRQNS